MHHLTSWRGVLAISIRLALGFCLMTVPSIDTRSQFFTPPSPKGTGEITSDLRESSGCNMKNIAGARTNALKETYKLIVVK